MAGLMQFDLVCPEKRLVSSAVSRVTLPGIEGDFTVLAGHAPFLTSLRPGIITMVTQEKSEEFFVLDGFAEVSATQVTVLSRQGFMRSAITLEKMTEFLSAAESNPDSGQYLRDLRSIATQMRLL